MTSCNVLNVNGILVEVNSDKQVAAMAEETRAVIKFCVGAAMTPTETMKFMHKGKRKVSRSLVFKWHKRFADGLTDITDQQRPGRPRRTETDVEQVRRVISEDRRRSVREIKEMTGLCQSSVFKIMTEDLEMKKVCARWVPRLLKEHEKETRVRVSQSFVNRFEREGNDFLHRIITMDETWLYLYEPESKQESMVWKHPQSPPPKKAKTCKSAGKFMFMFYADSDGMLLQHAVPSGTTVNADYYQKVIRRELTKSLRSKRPDVEIEQCIYHHDNAPAHRATETLSTIDFLGFERLEHAPYSPDCAPMNFAVFPRLKADLRGKRFSDLDELKLCVRSTVRSYPKVLFREIFDKWVERHRKCVNAGGEYFEKL